MDVIVDLDVELLPQLVVLSAVTENEASGLRIENHCCMVTNADELHAEIGRWYDSIKADGHKIIAAVARYVPGKVYQ